MSEPAIELSQLGRDFGDYTAVDDLSFTVATGEVVALLGPNGAGKTTTVRMLNGVLRPDRGVARVHGLDPETAGDSVRAITGVLTENAGIDDRLTALENVVFAARIGGLPRDEAHRRAGELLERFGMSDRADDVAQGFSTGQRKRVALARSLMLRPELLFLDEPTSGLDPVATRDVLDLIHSLARDHGKTVLLCTHFLAEANRLCDRVAVMAKGKLLAFGSRAELADTFWQGTRVTLELDPDPADRGVAEQVLKRASDLLEYEIDRASGEVTVRVAERHAIPALVAALVDEGIEIFGVVPHTASLEDVYFAITAKAST